jgi:predicted transcriptional regulator
MMSHLRRLPDAELMVMQAVWACPSPATSTEIEKHLPADHPIAQTTLLTLLSRLAEKGFLLVQKQGRSNVYSPTVTQHDYLSTQSRRFVDQLCGGSMSVFASALCGSGLSKEELAQLRQLLEEGDL